MTPLTMSQGAPTKLKPSMEAPTETTAARFLLPRRRCSGRSSARGMSGTAKRRCRGVARRFAASVASTSSRKLSTLCVISLVDGSPSKSDSANLITSQVITYLQTRRDNVQEGSDLIHPVAVVPGGDLKTGYGKRLQRSFQDDSARYRRGSAVTR
jgi:hypothetical protein